MTRSFSLFVLPALALATISALLRAQTPGRLLAEADTHLPAEAKSEGGQMLTSGVEQAWLPLLPNPGAGAVSITGQQPLSAYVTDDYFLAFADMCGDREIITQINAAPSNSGWAGLEVREDTISPQ